jgi:ubiquinone/menaquinone biosynthesis C-methylase UbiE
MPTMELAEYGRIADAEDRHWWYRNTRALMRDLLRPYIRPGIHVLDAGCGPGGNTALLTELDRVVGIDISPEAVHLANERYPRMEARVGDIADLPFDDGSFDIALAITVLAMVADDGRAVRELARVTRPGGAVLLIEPAIPRLRRSHDQVTRILRRYSLGRLEGLARDAGLTPVRTTHAYSFLVPPAVGLALAHRLRRPAARAASDLERDRLGGLFGALGSAERRLIARWDLPFGLSVIVLAERPGAPPGDTKLGA